MKNKYNLAQGIVKTVINAVIFLAPTLIELLPTDVANMTLSAGLYMLINFLKVKYM